MRTTAIPFALLFVACNSPTPAAPASPFPPSIEPSRAEDVLGPSLLHAAAAMLGTDATPDIRGVVRLLYGPTGCAAVSDGQGIGIRVAPYEPRASRIIAIDWTTTACTQPAPPTRTVSLIVSLRPPSAIYQIGSGGCWLLVNPDYVLVPTPTGILTQQGGWLNLRWTPTPDWAGRSVWAQCLVAAPGEAVQGHMLSPAVEIQVGSAL